MSQVLEWRERLETAHKMLHDSMTELITNKNYSEAERGLHVVDQLMLNVIEDMGGTVVRSGVWTGSAATTFLRGVGPRADKLAEICKGILPGHVPMKTAAEYQTMAEECFKWAREAHSNEARVSLLQLAQVWLDAASKLDGLSSTPTPPAPAQKCCSKDSKAVSGTQPTALPSSPNGVEPTEQVVPLPAGTQFDTKSISPHGAAIKATKPT